MKSKKLAGKKPKDSTQKYLDIAEIKDDMVVLNDGTVRGVLLVSSINFDLKSEDEQRAVISGYVNFLNSLFFCLFVPEYALRALIKNIAGLHALLPQQLELL